VSEFRYASGRLHAEGVDLSRIAAEAGTPAYVYSAAALRRAYGAYRDAFAGHDATICYAMKANGNLAVLRVLATQGSGADVVSEGELRRALAAGIPASRIIFSGVGKTEAEIAYALDAGIAQLNVESEPELLAIERIAAAKGRPAPIAIRVNPDVDAGTHAKITTGTSENKFGVDFGTARALYRHAAASRALKPQGLAVHIGSQLLDLAPYRAAFTRLAALAREIKAEGLPLTRLDLGGGLGIAYGDETPPPIADYARMAREVVGDLKVGLVLEPGRSVVGAAGVLIARVVHVKHGNSRRFVVVDAAMNDLLRPALYDARHAIQPLIESQKAAEPADVVGPVCETSDTFERGAMLPPLAAGDLVAFGAAGAYGAVMASTYNGRPLVPEVLVDGGRFAVVRRRPSHEEMLALDSVPAWLDGPVFSEPAR
jgi:diaminopimelate decarboxylase